MDILIRSFLWVLHASVTASITALLIILVLKLFNNHIGVRFQHALWIIVVIKLIMPLQFESNLSAFNLLHENHKSSLDIEKQSTIKNMTYATSDFLREGKYYWNYRDKNKVLSVDASPEKTNYIKGKVIKEDVATYILSIVSCVWAFGILASVVFLLIFKQRFKRKTLNLEELEDQSVIKLLDECKREVNINKDMAVYISDGFKSPCISGIVKPKIYIPQCVCSIDKHKYLYHVLLHELTHYKRKDLVYNSLAVIAVILHWFNPIVWFCMKKMKLQRECACDAYVLEIIGEEKAEDYGMTLINFSKLISSNNKALQLAVFFETKNQIRRRIEMIKNFKKGSYKMSVTAVACCIV
ncbi:M56 family metallopeptidase [Clostridium thailandense]|uniref:M56 family metallopeptidase n=1 Tax=Clostridium thailandense TaxID=2794346 RepID=UPI001FE71030|nr:M56 family metallopeptidase [Clostridium thailandense]